MLKGSKMSEESKYKMREKALGKKAELSNSWAGGKWTWAKTKTLERDNYTCRVCGLREPDIMQVDHIKPKADYPELRLDLNNLQTLCPNDHARKSALEQKSRVPWNKGKTYTKEEISKMNTSGLKLGPGWNRGLKLQTNTGRTHFKTGVLKDTNLKYEFNGISLSLGEWSKRVSIPYKRIWERLNRCGWTVEEALTIPVSTKNVLA